MSIDMTLRVSELVQAGFIGFGWNSQRMHEAEIWLCAAIKPDGNEMYVNHTSDSCEVPSSKNTKDFFSCCVARGNMHEAPKCVSPSDDLYYPLEVIDHCFSEMASFVTVRATVCKSEDEEKCFHKPKAAVDVIAAYNPYSTEQPHAFMRRASGRLDLNTGVGLSSLGDTQNIEFYVYHGISMLIIWLILVPVSVYIVRYMKGKAWRLVVHITAGSVTFSWTFSLILGFLVQGEGRSSPMTSHRSIGLTIIVLLCCMVATGEIRRTRELSNLLLHNVRLDRAVMLVHRYMGYALILLSWRNCYLGLDAIRPYESDIFELTVTQFNISRNMNIFSLIPIYVFWISIAIILLIFLITEIRRLYMRSKHNQNLENAMRGTMTVWGNSPPKFGSKTMTIETFLEMTRYGSDLCIVDGYVLDIGKFINFHPGGMQVLRYAIGADITEEFIGERHVSGISHLHSPVALRALHTLVKAKLDTPPSDNRNDIAPSTMNLNEILRESQHRFQRKKHREDEVFRNATILSIDYVTSEKRVELSPVIRIRLKTELENSFNFDNEFLLPGSLFMFRGRDKIGGIIERSYSPTRFYQQDISNAGPFSIFGTLSTYLSKIKLLSEPKKEIVYEFLLTLTPDDKMCNFLSQKKVKSHIMVRGPYIMSSVLDKIDGHRWKNVLLLASGTGIAPMLPIIDYFLDPLGKNIRESTPPKSKYDGRPRILLVWILKSKTHNFEGSAQLHKWLENHPWNFAYLVLYSNSAMFPSAPRKRDVENPIAPNPFLIKRGPSRSATLWYTGNADNVYLHDTGTIGKSPETRVLFSQSKNESNDDMSTTALPGDHISPMQEPTMKSHIDDSKEEIMGGFNMKGRLDKTLIARLLTLFTYNETIDNTSHRKTLIAVCGNPIFEDQCVLDLEELGLGSKQVVLFNPSYNN